MSSYDKHYKVENFFGDPYPELIKYMKTQVRGSLLDLGCGQGRDAIALARIGYPVTGVDSSKIGIGQMMQLAANEGLDLIGKVADIYEFDDVSGYDYLLLDSMFHFTEKDREKEKDLLIRIIAGMKSDAHLVICIQDGGKKVDTLMKVLAGVNVRQVHIDRFVYVFEDQATGHRSNTNYQMVVVAKI